MLAGWLALDQLLLWRFLNVMPLWAYGLGALLTGVFAAPQLGGQGIWDYVANKASPDYSIAGQLLVQAEAVGVTIVWSGVVAFIAFKLVDVVIGLRVPADAEREGLDINSHGESAYHL